MLCPKCRFDQPSTAVDCVRCGIVFAKYHRDTPPPAVNDAVAAWDAVAPPAADVPQWSPEVTETDSAARPLPEPVAHTTPAQPLRPSPSTQRFSERGSETNTVGLHEGHYTTHPANVPEVFDEAAFAAFRAANDPKEDEDVRDGRLGRTELTVLGTGLVAAMITYAIPFTRVVFSLIVTLFHEFGHAAVGWLFGIPSLPAFDFVYGGGWTHYGNFHPLIAVAIVALFGYGMWLFRSNRKSMILIGVLLLVWLLMVSAEWRRELVVASAGHAAEFVLAGIFFYKALAGVGWQIPAIERPLGAFVAFFVQIHSMAFAWRLMHDVDFLAWYREGKGGAAMNDLEIVSLDLDIYARMHTSIQSVAGILFVFSFVPIAIALLWYFQRSRWHRTLHMLRTADA
jgi:hypothetical protein